MIQMRRDNRSQNANGGVWGGADVMAVRYRAWSLRAIVLIVVAGATLPVSTACASKVAGRRLELSPAGRPLQRDLPLPAGFALVDESTEDWISGPLRFIRHCYEGRADKQDVRLFYRRQMPLVRWAPGVERTFAGRCTMSFSRERERCTVEIVNRKTLLGPVTRLTVSVAPAMAGVVGTDGADGSGRTTRPR